MTLTNGVEFSLVAGACCHIKFSNATGSYDMQSKNATLNVSSTGAKSITFMIQRVGGYGAYAADGTIRSNYWTAIYNGSTYVVLPVASVDIYEDS